MMRDLTGTLIGSYRLDKLLNDDDTVQAYLGVHTTLKKERIVYLLVRQDGEQPAFYVDDLTDRVRAAAKLDSQFGLVRVYDVGEAEKGPYFATDWVPGPSLEDMLQVLSRTHRQMITTDLIQLTVRVIRVLEHAYIRGGLHASLRPSTIKFRLDPAHPTESNYLPVLTDMGIASVTHSSSPEASAITTHKLLRSVGFLLYALLTNQADINDVEAVSNSVLAEGLKMWPFIEADRMMQLVERTIQSPPIEFGQGISLIMQELKTFQSLALPGQVSLSELYDYYNGQQERPLQDNRIQTESSAEKVLDPDPPLHVQDQKGGFAGVNGSTGERTSEPSVSPSLQQFKSLSIQVAGPNGDSFTREILNTSAIIGRSDKCDVLLSDSRASRRHLQIEHRSEGIFITDLESLNGTLLDGKPIGKKRAHPYAPGQVIRIGSIDLQVSVTFSETISQSEPVGLPKVFERHYVPTAESLAIPPSPYINELRQEIPIADFTTFPDDRTLAFLVPKGELHRIEPGNVATLSVYVVNFGRTEAKTARLSVSGVPPRWLSVNCEQGENTPHKAANDNQVVVRLKPTEQKRVDIVVAPQRTHLNQAGKYRLEISLQETDKAAVAVRRVPLEITNFIDFDWTVETDQNGSDMVVRVAVTNLGNRKENMTLSIWSDDKSELVCDPPFVTFAVEPGQQTQLQMNVAPHKRALIGRVKKHLITVQLGTQADTRTYPVEFVQKSRVSFGG